MVAGTFCFGQAAAEIKEGTRAKCGSLRLVPFDETIHVLPADEPASESSQEGRMQRLHAALGKLPVEFREVLLLYEIEGWSYKQIASALDLPVGTVMSRLSRARRRLQKELSVVQNQEVQNEL